MGKGNIVTYFDERLFQNKKEDEPLYFIFNVDGNGNLTDKLASFQTQEQLDAFARKLGFKYHWVQDTYFGKTGCTDRTIANVNDGEILETVRNLTNQTYKLDDYSVDRKKEQELIDFRKTIYYRYSICDKNLKKAKQIKMSCNGFLCDCLYVTRKHKISIYRPNLNCFTETVPNKIFPPLPKDEATIYQKIHGIF